ncbi:FliI/YscN family ATPase [Phaeovulum sp. W22_SRMD_FR3]|uniref:FliI/YscN family ATPase n=1 Tax=Phaeovulum sp. W22_SRMD_FR3 TaxID=3240274 RepID=UPI003F9B1E6F
MAQGEFELLRAEISEIGLVHAMGRVVQVGGGTVDVAGLSSRAALGDRVVIQCHAGMELGAEVLALKAGTVTLLTDGPADGIAIGDSVELIGQAGIAPDDSWIGRIVDPFGRALDGRPLRRGAVERNPRAGPPPAASRRRLGARLETGIAVFNTLLPLVRGQRIGLFAGSGVGKSTLLAKFAKGVDADVVVIALVGERGRELREFVESTMGPEGMARTVVVAATSDTSPLVRRRCAWAAMSVAEHFRDQGKHVLFLADSVTRFAEAHREVALAGGEPPSLRGFPPSTSHQIMSLAERSGPGPDSGEGDITAIFSVLVAGSDMEEPVADILRGVLDGHVVMDRAIAERGRFPAIDLLRSVSRSLPHAATKEENTMIGLARRLLGAYDRAEMMIQAGLYVHGSDPMIDAAIKVWPSLDNFLSEDEPDDTAASFRRLSGALGQAAQAFVKR